MKTDHVKMENSLEEQFHLAVQNNQKAILFLKLTGEICYANDAFYQLTGFAAENVIGSGVLSLFHRSVENNKSEFILEEMIQNKNWDGFLVNREELHDLNFLSSVSDKTKKTIDEVWRVTFSLVSGSYEGNEFIQVSINDAAEEVQACIEAENKITQIEARSQAILEKGVDSVVTITTRGIIESFNPSAEKMFGYDKSEVIGENINILIPSPYKKQHDMYLSRYMETGIKNVIKSGREVVGERKNGSTFPLHLSVTEVVFKDEETGEDKVQFYAGIIRDLTDEKKYREKLWHQTMLLKESNGELEVAKLKAEEADNFKSQFLANISHEIRTPMTAILGFSDLLQESISDQESLESVKTIKRNGEYLLQLINDILDLSKIEAGKISLEYIECSPASIIEEVKQLMWERAFSKNIQLEIECHPDVPAMIVSDPTRLQQVLINIVGNAIKFTNAGKVHVCISFLQSEQGIDQVHFEVTDTGIGMSEEQLDKIFDPFNQANCSITRKYGGTGLGLSISEKLIQKLGGDLKVESELGQGSHFTIVVPVEKPEGINDTSEQEQPVANDAENISNVKKLKISEQTSVNQSQTIQSSKKEVSATKDIKSPLLDSHILLVEDGPDNQALIQFILKRAGASVTIADNGQIAIDLINAKEESDESQFNLILMDMLMPVLDGYEATRKLRELGYKLPIVALTANAMAEDRKKCLAAGCDDYASKPIDRSKLISMISQYISK